MITSQLLLTSVSPFFSCFQRRPHPRFKGVKKSYEMRNVGCSFLALPNLLVVPRQAWPGWSPVGDPTISSTPLDVQLVGQPPVRESYTHLCSVRTHLV